MLPWFKKPGAVIFLLVMVLLSFLAGFQAENRRQILQEDLQILQEELHKLHLQHMDLKNELEKNRELLQKAEKRWEDESLLLEKMQQWLETWQVNYYETTAYAPFDAPQSGLCHDGDPSITAIGTRLGPGTIAVDPRDIPFGTPLWVEGYGWGKALDTGAAMRKQEKLLDLYFHTRAEALSWGRKKVLVVSPLKI